MTKSSQDIPRKSAFSVALYALSVLALVMATLTLVWLLSVSHTVDNMDLFFQLAGIEQLAPLFLHPLQAVLTCAGIVVFALLFAITAILFATGRLAARQTGLTERIRVLEEKLQQ